MNRIVVDVPNEKMQAFEEAMNKLDIGFMRESNFEIPEEHKDLVRKIIAETKPENYRDFQEVIAEIRSKLKTGKSS